MRIAHVTTLYEFGGSSRLMTEIAARQSQSGEKVFLIILGNPPEKLPGWFSYQKEFLESDIYYLGYSNRYTSLKDTFLAVYKLSQVLRSKKIDVVHSYLWVADVICAVASRVARAKHIGYFICEEAWLTSSKLHHRVRRALTRMAFGYRRSLFLAISTSTKDYHKQYLGLRDNKLHLAYPFLDTERYREDGALKEGKEGITFGYAAWFYELKRHEDLLYAFAETFRGEERVVLKLAGRGTCMEQCIKLSKELGIESQVDFLGEVEDMVSFYNNLDVLVFPSSSEGSPGSILEAMSCGIPVIGTRVGGISELVEDGVSGLIIEARNVVDLGLAMGKLAENRELRLQFGESSRKRVLQNFRWENFSGVLENTYSSFR